MLSTRPRPRYEQRSSRSGRHAWVFMTLWLIAVAQAAALAMHVWSTVARGQWLFMMGGVIAYPVGMAHGVGVWLRLWS